MVDWNKMKSDITKGVKEGLDKVIDGAETVAKKTGEVTAEGQKKIKIFNIKRKIQGYMEDLGVAIYNAENQTPGTVTDKLAKETIKKIKAANKELKTLEKS
jgi:hypothetical protein